MGKKHIKYIDKNVIDAMQVVKLKEVGNVNCINFYIVSNRYRRGSYDNRYLL